MKKEGKKQALQFKGRKQSVQGVSALTLAFLEIAGILAMTVVSSRTAGNGGSILGIVGLLLFAAAVTGFVLAIRSLKEQDIYFVVPVLATLLNGLMMILLLSLYIVGI